MEKKPENRPADDWLKNLPAQAENVAFDAEELLVCPKCGRKIPPTRLKCLYCGAELEIGEFEKEMFQPILRKLESWEKGFNIIYLPEEKGLDEQQQNEIAKTTRLEKEILQNISDLKKPLPLARAESVREAEMVMERFRESGIETIILSDDRLAAAKLPRRLRELEFFEDKLLTRLFNTGQSFEIAREDLILIVIGSIFERRVEATEKRSRKGENKLLNATETASDEMLIDLYSRGDGDGFRIAPNGFDFSCLGFEKQLLAAENMQKLIEKLRSYAPHAKFVDDFSEIRTVLAHVWEVEEKKDSSGLVRERFGKFNLGNVTIVSNLRQFTKYSRLRRHLL